MFRRHEPILVCARVWFATSWRDGAASAVDTSFTVLRTPRLKKRNFPLNDEDIDENAPVVGK